MQSGQNQVLVQFSAHRDLQWSLIGGLIVCICDVKESSDEAMGPASGFLHRGISGEGSQSADDWVYGISAEQVGPDVYKRQ